MQRENLNELIAALSPEQQAAVEEFIRFLQKSHAAGGNAISFREALDSFAREHGELLRRLAQ